MPITKTAPGVVGTLLSLLLLCVALLPTPGLTQEPSFFRIGTGGAGGTYYPIGGLLALAVSHPPGSRPCEQDQDCGVPELVAVAQSANGSVANVMAIHIGGLESGFAQSDVAYWAYTGSGIFHGKQPLEELRTIASLYSESIHLVARRGSGIQSISDLRGKRVALDEPGSGTLIDARIVLEAYGLDTDDITAMYIKPDQAIKRLEKGELDAFFMVAGYPIRSVSELAARSGAQLVPITGPEVTSLLNSYRFFSTDLIPGGVYPGIEKDTATLSVGAQWITSSTLDDELVYKITRSLWSGHSRKLLDHGHARGRDITLGTALEGVSVPLHKGAERYYREIGMKPGSK